MAGSEQYHVKTLKGLEELLAQELRSLGAEHVQVLNRGVSFQGGRAMMYKVNFASRLALRVLVPLFRFEVSNADMLYRRVKRFDWNEFMDVKTSFAIDSVVHSPHFKHSHFVSLKVKDAIADRFREQSNLRPSVNREDPDILINVHISGRWATVSLDSSGYSLHKRGYRRGHFEAPLNEVLAAGMIMASGWKGDRPLLDPMCGSGTLAIEAALMAANIPPGLFRKGYGFERWKDFDPGLMEHVLHSLPPEKEVTVPIGARDVDPDAVRLCRSQVKHMELDKYIEVSQADFFESEGQEGLCIIMNPPYGERLKSNDLQGLYQQIGSTLKHHYPGSDAWLLSSSREALKQVGLKPSSKRILYNGALECSYVNYTTFKGNWKEFKQGQDC